jgi:hypothetical protein
MCRNAKEADNLLSTTTTLHNTVLELHMNGFRQYVVFDVRIFPFSMVLWDRFMILYVLVVQNDPFSFVSLSIIPLYNKRNKITCPCIDTWITYNLVFL